MVQVLLNRVLAVWRNVGIEHEAQTFKDRGLAGAFATDEAVYSWIKSDPNILEKASGDVYSNYLAMLE